MPRPSLIRLLAAMQYLTRLPVRLPGDASPPSLASQVADYPSVGLVIGLVGALVGALAHALAADAPLVAGLLVLATWLVLSGAFHVDGLADSFDALLSGKRGAEAGAILKDSRVGAMGAVAVFLVLSLDAVAIGHLLQRGQWGAVALAPAAGRLGCALLCWRGRSPDWVHEKSLGRSLLGHVSPGTFFYAAAVTAIAGALLVGWSRGWMACLAALAAAWIVALISRRCLGGLTGDSLGASIEMGQCAALVAALWLSSPLATGEGGALL